jgi:hypothetical protein
LNAPTIFFVVLFFILAVVTIVGHGIWVLLAHLFGGSHRTSRQSSTAPYDPNRRVCPRCGWPRKLGQQVCLNCNWSYAGEPVVGDMTALRALRRQLQTFEQEGVLDDEARAKLSAAIEVQEQRLLLAAQKTTALRAGTMDRPGADGVRPDPASPQVPTESQPVVPPPLPPSTIGERAKKYAASRTGATSEALAEPMEVAEQSKRREALSRIFAAFMEEKNIRWGELVGGLLIVGCSIALVISFWAQIASQPLLKFVLFNGVTAALFGVGMYTDRRWKIHTTSHGVLVIATLLVPLNFLAIAAFTQSSPPTDLLSLSGEAVSLIVFTLLVYFAGRVLAPADAVLTAVAVIFPCLMQLLVRRFARPTTPLLHLYALAAAPTVTYLIAVFAAIRRRWTLAVSEQDASTSLSEREANRVFIILGVTTAAALMPIALLLHNVPPLSGSLHWLSPLVVLFGLPALLVGLLFWRRLVDRSQSSLQTTGIGVGALGTLVMLGAVAYAWPDPATLLPASLVTAAAMLVVANSFAISAAHVPAGVSCAAVWIVGFYLVRGDVAWTITGPSPMRNLFLSAATGNLLLALVAAFGAIAAGLWHFGRSEASKMYAILAAAATIVSLALVLWFGWGRPGDPANATWTLAVYAVAALIGAVLFNRRDVALAGSIVLLATIAQGVVFRWNSSWQLQQPWIVGLLAHATLIGLGCVLLRYVTLRIKTASMFEAAFRMETVQVFAYSALVTSMAAAIWTIITCLSASMTTLAVHAAWLAGVWLILAALFESPQLFTASQAAFVVADFCVVTALAERRPWYAQIRHPWLDPWFLEAQGIGVAAYCLVLSIVRRGIERMRFRGSDTVVDSQRRWLATSRQLLDPSWPAVDSVAAVVLAALLTSILLYAIGPGVGQELSPTVVIGKRVVSPVEQFEITGIDHRHAADRGGWLLLAATAIALSARLPKYVADWRRLGLAVLGMSMCLLVAARWESQVATASALRWLSAVFFGGAAAASWLTESAAAKRQVGPADGYPDSSSRVALTTTMQSICTLRNLLIAFVVLIYIALAAYVGLSALNRAAPDPRISKLWLWISLWSVPIGLGAVALIVESARDRSTSSQKSASMLRAWALESRWVVLIMALAPMAVLLMFIVARTLIRQPLVGADPASWFRRIGFEISYGVPLVLVALTFIGYAIRDRSSVLAFAAGPLFNVVATMVVLVRVARSGGALDAFAWITVAQVNAIVSGIVALMWQASVAWHQNKRQPVTVDSVGEGDGPETGDLNSPNLLLSLSDRWPLLLVSQVVVAAALVVTFLAPATVRLATAWSPPGTISAWVSAAGGPAGWLALALSAAGVIWLLWGQRIGQPIVAMFAAALASIVALTVLRLSGVHAYAFHALLIGSCLVAWLLPLCTWVVNRRGPLPLASYSWAAWPVRIFGIVTVWLALWEYSAVASWWVVLSIGAIGARNILIARRECRRGSMWIAAMLIVFAAGVWWLDLLHKAAAMSEVGDVFEFLWFEVLIGSALAIVSVWAERRQSVGDQSPSPRTEASAIIASTNKGIAYHRFAAWAFVALLLLTTGAGLLADLINESFAISELLAWAACIAAATTAAACLWDPAIRWPIACLYCVGLIAVGIYLDALDLHPPLFQWALANALASYSLATSGLWSIREKLRAVATKLGVPVETISGIEPQQSSLAWEGAGQAWLVRANFLIGISVLLLVAWIELTIPNSVQRMVAAYAVGAQAFALGLLARGAVRTRLQYLALVWGVFFAVMFGWAWLPPDFIAPWLHRLVVTVVGIAAAVIVYGFGLVKLLKRTNEWTEAAARLVPPLAVLAAVLIFVILGIEVAAYVGQGDVPIVPAALAAVVAALACLVVAALAAALVPGRDPLGLSERGRMLYVYFAEALAALLFLHIRVTMPWLFRGWFLRFWPLVVMAVAFVGVGLSELFRRRNERVLYEPLENTGAILPLLPALGFWVISSQVHYSLLLLAIGVLYASLSVLRRSFLYGVLSAVAANCSLWYLLHQSEGLDLTQHPQLWLIPPALCALVAGYINRQRLTDQQSAALRYASAIVIYVSSTADIFINGVGEAPWLPGVLAALSIIGGLAGIVLRVRAFLYLGTAFLVVAIMTVIWHAAEAHTWIWWLTGIVTGALIIALFGLFEKRRDDVLRIVEGLKHWQA